MESIVSFLGSGWAGTVIGAIGIAVGIALYLKSRQLGYIAYVTKGETLIGTPRGLFESDVEVRFRGVPVSRLTTSEIVVWNDGPATIDGKAIVAADRLRLELTPEDRILDAAIMATTRTVCGISVDLSSALPNLLYFTFDYLDPGDGARIRVLHSGTQRRLVLQGTIRGSARSVRDRGGFYDANRSRSILGLRTYAPRGMLVVSAFTFAGALVIAASAMIGHWLWRGTAFSSFDRTVVPILSVCYLLLSAYPVFRYRPRYPQRLADDVKQG